jgi:hypothetical protein
MNMIFYLQNCIMKVKLRCEVNPNFNRNSSAIAYQDDLLKLLSTKFPFAASFTVVCTKNCLFLSFQSVLVVTLLASYMVFNPHM